MAKLFSFLYAVRLPAATHHTHPLASVVPYGCAKCACVRTTERRLTASVLQAQVCICAFVCAKCADFRAWHSVESETVVQSVRSVRTFAHFFFRFLV